MKSHLAHTRVGCRREPDWSQSRRDATRKRAGGRIQPSVPRVLRSARPPLVHHQASATFQSWLSQPLPSPTRTAWLCLCGISGAPRSSARARRLCVKVRLQPGDRDHGSHLQVTRRRTTARGECTESQSATVDSRHKQWKLLKNLGQEKKQPMHCTGSSAFIEINFGLCIYAVCLEGGGLPPCSPAKFFASCCGRFASTGLSTVCEKGGDSQTWEG